MQPTWGAEKQSMYLGVFKSRSLSLSWSSSLSFVSFSLSESESRVRSIMSHSFSFLLSTSFVSPEKKSESGSYSKGQLSATSKWQNSPSSTCIQGEIHTQLFHSQGLIKNSPKLTAIQFVRSYFGEFGIRSINNLTIYIFSIHLTCLLDIILILKLCFGHPWEFMC